MSLYSLKSDIVRRDSMVSEGGMSDVIDAWNTLIKIQAEQSLSNENVHKIEELLSSDDIEDIRNGMTVLTTLSAAHLCRYLNKIMY